MAPGARRAIILIGVLVVAAVAVGGTMIGRFVSSVSTVRWLEAGECIEDFFVAEGEFSEISLLQTIGCSEPHALEVFATSDQLWSPEPAPHPGMARLFVEGEAWCAAEFERFTGEPFVSSTLGMWTFVPVVEGWADGDRSVQCLLGSYDETTLTTGSLRDFARRTTS